MKNYVHFLVAVGLVLQATVSISAAGSFADEIETELCEVFNPDISRPLAGISTSSASLTLLRESDGRMSVRRNERGSRGSSVTPVLHDTPSMKTRTSSPSPMMVGAPFELRGRGSPVINSPISTLNRFGRPPLMPSLVVIAAARGDAGDSLASNLSSFLYDKLRLTREFVGFNTEIDLEGILRLSITINYSCLYEHSFQQGIIDTILAKLNLYDEADARLVVVNVPCGQTIVFPESTATQCFQFSAGDGKQQAE
jgi:hypothetical protein